MDDLIGKSFLGYLYASSKAYSGPIKCTQHTGDIAGDGWLQHRQDECADLLLRFDYLEHIDDRIHYIVSAGPDTERYAGAKLGVSRNGYLGFYEVAEVSGIWKLELAAAGNSEATLQFTLRDPRGYRVAVSRETRQRFRRPNAMISTTGDWLSVENGEVVEFRLQITEYL